MIGDFNKTPYFGILEFKKEVFCFGDVLDMEFRFSVNGSLFSIFTPKVAELPPEKGFDVLLAPKKLNVFKKEWGTVYRRPNIIVGIKAVCFGTVLSEHAVNTLFAKVPEWKSKLENIFELMMHRLMPEQENIRLAKISDGRVCAYTGINLFTISEKMITEIPNPHSMPAIRVNLVNDSWCLSSQQFKECFEMASASVPLSQTYVLLLAAYRAFTRNDYRSAVVLGGCAIENSILKKIVCYCKEKNIELKRPIGELGKKFKKLKEYNIDIPVEDYKTRILEVRNNVTHKGIDVGEANTLRYLEDCRSLICVYEPSIIGYEEEN